MDFQPLNREHYVSEKILEKIHLKMGQWRGVLAKYTPEETARCLELHLLSDMAELPYQEPLTEEEREELALTTTMMA